MRFDILSLFPGFFEAPLDESIIGKAVKKGLIEVQLHNIRDFAADKHRTTDDSPYGGGAGMVMKVEPVVSALEAIKGPRARQKVILTTPQGIPFTQKTAKELSELEGIIIICGRYEGFDERIRAFVDIEVSIGDYILTGGEIPALVVIDSVARFIPGVLGDEDSLRTDSFSRGLLEYPQYTRPEEFRGMRVPGELLSGNHGLIERWRRKKSLKRTLQRRPDLIDGAELTEEDRVLLGEIKKESYGGP
jgi:tRNA (guanine37-N1)-methyltransferase